MLSSRRRLAAACTASALAGAAALVSLPSASAEQCTVTVKLVDGSSPLTFTVNVPPGTPLSSLSLPISGPVASETESCQAPAPASGASQPSSASTTPTSTSTTPAGPPRLSGHAQAQKPSVNKHAKPTPRFPDSAAVRPAKKIPPGRPNVPATVLARPTTPPLQAPGGAPSPLDPTFSFSLPGPAPLGVPNFFIDNFQIPPFLLPIYQAAGIEYDVPWQALAAINEIETDYGRNLSVSSAGAVGWMQFLPSTFKEYAVDANGDGIADPYNPEDAIFTAARYLNAAGASKNLAGAIFAYNHASWYVQSVLLRAKLIGGMPEALIGALTDLVQGHFPVAAKSTYADDNVERLAKSRVHGTNAAVTVGSDPNATGVNIFAAPASPVIAVNDGKIVGLGQNARLGRYIQLQDATGNTYTYAQLGSVPKQYAVPKPVHETAAQIKRQLDSTPPPAPSGPASAGTQNLASSTVDKTVAAITAATRSSAALPQSASDNAASGALGSDLGQVKERLFAHPSRPASYRAGGAQQVAAEVSQIANFQQYFSSTLHLARNQYTLAPLRKGAIVVAGTILGRIGAGVPGGLSSHVLFKIQPAGKNAPEVDPKPILDGWKLLEATAVYRADGKNPFFGPDAKNPSIGQILLMSKEQLEQRILGDRHVKVYSCGLRDIQAGLVDRRILASLEFLSASGLDPTVSGLVCGHTLATGDAGAAGTSAEISQINGIPVQGHQGAGSITDIAIRRLETLQAALKPDQIISLMTYKGQTNTLALPDHADQLQVTYTPLFGQDKRLSAQIASALKPHQWIDLINRLSQLQEPAVSGTPSPYAVTAAG